MTKTIALLTDFGNDDIYVGVMKGVMRSICPDADFIDITHKIAPQHVREAAFGLMNAVSYFPHGTVFLVVIDPGVGSARRPVAVQAAPYMFVAPDNGVLSYALSRLGAFRAVELSNPNYQREAVSNTFHGRDIFAPAAAHLANGLTFEELGSPVDQLVQLPAPLLDMREGILEGEVIHIDRFGNVITSIGRMLWLAEDRITLTPSFGEIDTMVHIDSSTAEVVVNNEVISTIQRSYSDVRRGEVLALLGSSGYLEISVNQGNAAMRLDMAVGDRVEVRLGVSDATIRH